MLPRLIATSAAAVLGLAGSLAPPVAASPEPGISLHLLGRYESGSYLTSSAEIVAHDPRTQRLFVVNAFDGTLDVLDIRDPSTPRRVAVLATPGANSVAVHNGVLAVAQQAQPKTDPGTVAFFDAGSGRKLREVTVGALPDMLTFTPDGRRVVVANEGEPSSYCADGTDPVGSVSVIDLSAGVAAATVRTAGFESWNGREDQLRAAGVRIFGPNASAAQDLEPEYVAVDKTGRTAWVTLQENNALATVDLKSATVTAIVPLGHKDHSQPGNGFDASNRDGKIDVRSRPTLGMYQPDAIASFHVKGRTWLVTANEGDAREYDCFDEQARVGGIDLDPTVFPDAAMLKASAELGRLRVTTTSPRNEAGQYTQLHSFGGRSISVWDHTGRQIWDSADQLEQLIARELPAHFNANHEENDFDSRSDDKGPEPEGVVVGKIRGRSYAFVGLERVGGIVTFDLTDPRHPVLAGYVNSRDFAGDPEAGTAGDLGPEGLLFIPARRSPTGRPLLAVGNEVSGSTAIYEIR